MGETPLEKDNQNERAIPMVWRPMFVLIVEALVERNFQLRGLADYVRPLDSSTADINRQNIDECPDKLVPLSERSWETSTHLWMGTHWDVLIDLSVGDGETGDLVLYAKVLEDGKGFVFEPGLVYVP
jgi:hypothetical protein